MTMTQQSGQGHVDPRTQLFVPGAGGRWMTVSEVEREMRERGVSRLTLPGTLSVQQVQAYRKLRDSKYFLVRNRGGATGERYRCSKVDGHNCNGYHEYFTYAGINRPFRGLEGALYGYAQINKDSRLQRKVLDWAPHLDDGHPFTARQLGPREPGVDLIAVAIGVLVDITKQQADALVAAINARVRDPAKKLVL